ncbi:MAG: multifunctional oxoglutarate decarboxylase/oxoglutarate dehydrogenase thiamine pyrophosphate-binding subunit/dihydrolipoyllysine-residue succinyltransferase subunit [Candidatus Cyclonatronum sp.]|uniref:multifunctional oxoglutarate decarboxylase/oxoglutarate dehydrogenase thiamine pyrophosphate-binding subunit/dihydrolipoyllysine-residue succinyltransferase subunit n=1 Tax=Cyclonatronum sp. TaxID=3024185 RepID=UPI0025BA61E7|nr:multifunctional oxoglutarate decarboxylase/oxoglutarate dehydrogenase thiamine pyrophosphate-binding subunit/dihydrolipoyllysine-residue succinyltransferase subunit [Cyclonatronum sp.]MCC5933179.1 multifunctional oxoglutarate decarboxylase/oxoglutarate dehydrogenase thiamine pyrophosphate-binding subunit/dihydrolipoyllysine-residue succinyltransferase subunit [Balneolales bacterium]MCH8486316.1 multifunctional oxoglutarate decarboxylase/oxoglutarate dehydrogenase thiamine pyrophosphate-binding
MKSLEELFGPNAALVEELLKQYQEDPDSVPEYWRNYFDEYLSKLGDGSVVAAQPAAQAKAATNGSAVAQPPAPKAPEAKAAPAAKAAKKPAEKSDDVRIEPLRGASAKIAENMDESLELPTATSLRVIPVKMLFEDRNIINKHLTERGEPKATFTHFIGWAVIRALKEVPSMNAYYDTDEKGRPVKVYPNDVNLGIAIDLPGKGGSRNLVVANIKKVDKMTFREFLHAYYELIARARNGQLDVPDFQGTTISITNPGTIGTVSSLPRLMKGQGTIVATGAMDYPAEFQSMSEELLNHLGISKVMTMTSTYDHRIIQGAESGMFLSKIHTLLTGNGDFYDSIFADLDIPYDPIPFGRDNYSGLIGGNADNLAATKKAVSVLNLINMYRTHGHVLANINPLKHGPGHHPELDYEYHGLTMWDMDREFYCGGLGGLEKAPLRDIVSLLRDTYCGKIGAEYTHILNLSERNWLTDSMESTLNVPDLDKEDRRLILKKLNQASAFEEFLHKKYIGHKRFSLEGAESVIPTINHMLERAGGYGVEEVVFGMAHRGRLNVLVNIMGKSYKQIFSEFEGNIDPDSAQGSGDVKYHLGTRSIFKTADGKEIKLELMPNPSHLESVNPVVEGAVRAKQDLISENNEDSGSKVIPLLIHGDAAFAGQGVVAETLTMSQLKGYKTGGTIHLIINNQIGFTTLPQDGRSTRYASDLAKMILAPIFHVNGDDPEACVHAMNLALDYRQRFGKDVVIDLICYRKHGHNEGDEPAFTQPGLYREIKDHPQVREIYTQELLRKKELSQEEVDEIFKEFDEILEQAFNDAKSLPSYQIGEKDTLRKYSSQSERNKVTNTSIDSQKLIDIAYKINTVPSDFDANPKLLRILAKRSEIVEKNQKKIDWGYGEALAFGSLLVQGVPIRLAGQDSERGTFSHRHAVLHGTETSQKFTPLNHLDEGQAKFQVYNSLLSEFAALGYEFGYSASRPESLVLWEAQFGDFVNGAQIIIDQYLSSSETKWRQTSSLMMLLPHGYEGQGPEHSSARIERFLQLCAEDNMRICNCTTPAQLFHLIRRQALSPNKKPTILFTPKSLLRHPLAVSSTEELANGRFNYVLGDAEVNASDVRKIVFCSGKVYYDLYNKRKETEAKDIALVRIEQYYPFPDADVRAEISQYPNLREIVWCQEEPRNMGAWTYIRSRFEYDLKDDYQIKYAGRFPSASPAAGTMKLHTAEQEKLVAEALK